MPQGIKKVGNYKLIKSIGHGATAQVFQGRKNGSNDRYAIKMIRLSGLSPKQREMITKQVSIIKNISHPNIVKLIDSLETTNNYYLIFEFCEKGDLQHFLKSNHTPLIPQQTAQKIIYCLADAIALIHSKGIVHRDIKLTNILLKKDCQIKLADFGFAKEVDQNFMMQTYCGTPITMAPQILQGKYYDKKCDIWSLGVILFQLVYGKLPFPINQGYNKFVQLVTSKQLEFPSKPKVSQIFKELLLRALQKNPQKRLSINEFLENKWVQQGNNQNKINQSCKVQSVGQLLRNVSGQIKIQPQQKQKEKQKASSNKRPSKSKQRNQLQHQSSEQLGQNNQNIVQQQQQQEQQIQQQNKQEETIKAQKKIHHLEMLVSFRVYNTLVDQITKIISIHKRRRSYIEKQIQQQSPFKDKLKDSQIHLRELLYKLDQNFIQHLFQTSITISTQTDLQKFKLSNLKNLEKPQSLSFKNHSKPMEKSAIINSSTSKKQVINMAAGSTLLDFLRNSLVVIELQNQKKFLVYKLVIEYLEIMRRFHIRLEILFPTHHFVELSLNKILDNMKSGQCISLSKQQNLKRSPEGNYVTIAMECSEKDEKMGQVLKNLKINCEKRVNEIQKELNGYY